MNNKLIFERINEFIDKNEPPQTINKIGLFGSFVMSDIKETNDIDILVFENKDIKNEDEIIDEILKSITKEDTNNLSLLKTFSNDVYNYLINLSRYVNIPAKIAIGPVINEPKHKYLHINASFTDSLWEKFNQRLPIHSQLIAHNYVPILGSVPEYRNLNNNDFKKYIDLMDKRFDNFEITLGYIRKIVKSLALRFNYNSADYDLCLDFLFNNKFISKKLLIELQNLKKESQLNDIYQQLKPLFLCQ